MAGAVATTASAETRGAKAEAIQFLLRGFLDCFPALTMMGERAVETSPVIARRSCAEAIQLFPCVSLECFAEPVIGCAFA